MKFFGIVSLLFLFLLLSSVSEAGKWKLRAREHVETHKLKSDTLNTTYKGLSNTINAWWEVPYKYAIGLSFSPVLSNLKFSDDTTFGTKIKLVATGIEGKYFPHPVLGNTFIRLGAGTIELKPSSSEKNRSGSFFYYGLGYEIPFKKFGLALEVAQRSSSFDKGLKVDSFTPSIGFHFYEMF